MSEETLSEYLKVRITPQTKQRLEEIAERNIYTNSVSQHARIAIEEYIQKYEVKQESDRVAA